jgi:hypothetical protein
MEELTRVRGFGPSICPLVRLIDICPQGTESTLWIRGCQPDVIRVGSSSKIIFDHRDPMTHMLALLLVPILWGCCRPEIIHVCSIVCHCLSLPSKCVSRGNLVLSLVHFGVQLNHQCLHLQVDLQHRSDLHILSWTPIDCLLLEIILSLI